MAHLGITVDEVTLRHCCRTDRLGTTAKDTVNCALSYGLQALEGSDTTWSELMHWCEQGIYPIVYLNLLAHLESMWLTRIPPVETGGCHEKPA